jgi:CRP-like cAMP-binding protein
VSTDPRNNSLLAGLPEADFKLIEPHLTVTPFPQGTLLAEAGEEMDQVYFPLGGMISVLTVLRDGEAIETATIGRDGVLGGPAAFGPYRTRVRAIVQIPVVAATLSAVQLRAATETSPAIQRLCIGYNEVLLTQARVGAACNALHLTEARFCRWLLQASRISGSRRIHLTHEFLSEMLGVRRTSVTEIAVKLQLAGLISYTRGVIDIIDPYALQERACECFEILLEEGAI